MVQFLDRIQDMLKQMAQRFEQIRNLKRFVWMDWFLEAPFEGLVMKLYPQDLSISIFVGKVFIETTEEKPASMYTMSVTCCTSTLQDVVKPKVGNHPVGESSKHVT